MTEDQIRDLGPAFATYLAGYRPDLGRAQNATHFAAYCHGLLTDLPRKSVEPLALASGIAVRTLQEFVTTNAWDHDAVRDRLQEIVAGAVATATVPPPLEECSAIASRRFARLPTARTLSISPSEITETPAES